VSHPEHDRLWAAAQGPDPELQAHLDACASCRGALEDIRRAQLALRQVPPPPPLPPALAARVGAALAEAADRKAVGRGTWWQGLLARPGWLALAAGLLVVAGWRLVGFDQTPPFAAASPAPSPLANLEPPAQPTATPTPVAPLPPAPAPAPAPRKLSASVASARRARVQDLPASAAQVLVEGDRLRTESGGNLWLKLPDGSRAGLTGATSVTLQRLEAGALELEVKQGSLALVVPHRADRSFTVRAGEVEVVDLGTSFSVSRTASRVLVAVEEGVVEVHTPAGVQTVGAGRALSVHDGQLTTSVWAPVVAQPAAPAAAAEAPYVPGEAARLAREEEGDDDDGSQGPESASPPALAAERPGLPDESWAPLPPRAEPWTPPPPPPVGSARVRLRGPPAFSLEELERRVREFQRSINEAFITPAAREGVMREVARRAKAGDCLRALREADLWLGQLPTKRPEEVVWRARVLEARERCRARLAPSTPAPGR
jgi:FecR protein